MLINFDEKFQHNYALIQSVLFIKLRENFYHIIIFNCTIIWNVRVTMYITNIDSGMSMSGLMLNAASFWLG